MLRERLDQCIDPLDPADHYPILFNIVSGKLAAESANVQNALQIGKGCMQAYENKLPQGFYNRIGSHVSPWIQPGNGLTWEQPQLLTQKLYLHDLFSHELAPIPTSSKTKLNNYLQVEESYRTVERPDLIVLDSCAILWTINCPMSGTRHMYMRD